MDRTGRRRKGRRNAVAVAAGAILALLSTGTASALRIATTGLEPAAPPPASAEPTPTTLATTTSVTTAAPPPSSSTTAPPATAATTVPPAAEPRIAIEVIPAQPRVGERVRFVVTATQPGNCCYILVDPGDGGTVVSGAGQCTAAPGGTQRYEVSHVYNRPGRWQVRATADAGFACDDLDAVRAAFPGGRPSGATIVRPATPALPRLKAEAVVVVAEGPTTAQGPAPPRLEVAVAAATADDPSGVAVGDAVLSGTVVDADGWLRRVVVDWGDGSTPTTLTQGRPCWSRDNGWPPSTALLFLQTVPSVSPVWAAAASHRYTAAGPATVTITATSSGCDGTEEQRTSRSLRWPGR